MWMYKRIVSFTVGDMATLGHVSRPHLVGANSVGLGLFTVFSCTFCPNAPKYCSFGGGGVYVYVLKSVRKGPFRNIWVRGMPLFWP